MVILAVILENSGQAEATPARGPPSYIRLRPRKCPSGYRKGMDGVCRKKSGSSDRRRSYKRMQYRT